MTDETISPDFPYQSHYVDVHGSKMHYIEEGVGDPILFLHGIPTYSYVWRNVIPLLATLGRCIAPDLIGFGKSDKPDLQYSIDDHINYIEQFIKALQLKKITFVLHGWGSIIGFNYAMEHENNCNGLAFYESYIHPVLGEELSLPSEEQKYLLLHPNKKIHLNGPQYIEQILHQSMMRTLSKKEMQFYQEPFLSMDTGKQLLTYFTELPSDNNHTNQIIKKYSEKLTQSKLPKLMLYSVPGFLTTIATVMWAKQNLPLLEVVEIGEALHYAQENNPTMMGEAISIWLQGLEQQFSLGQL